MSSKLIAVILAVCIAPLSAQERPADVQAILDRAGDYVAAYLDQQLGNVVASETYVQTATFYVNNRGIPLRQQRRTESDFLIALVGKEHIGIRKVNRVDGVAVKSVEPSLESLLDDSPLGVRKRIAALKEESSQYNIGLVQRTLNVPVFALSVVRREEAGRFSFIKAGTPRINGVQTVELKFREQRSPTLVHGLKGESLISTGSVWIEAATGRVLKTEFYVENPYSEKPAKGRATVTYTSNRTLGILIPERMEEFYETEEGTVSSIANYSNFRSFKVDAKSEIQLKQ